MFCRSAMSRSSLPAVATSSIFLPSQENVVNMKQMKAMSVLAVYSMALGLAVLITSSPAHAQRTYPSIQVAIPYEFHIGSKPLPAGSYTFSLTDNTSVLLVTHANASPITTLITARIAGTDEFLRKGALVFDNNDGHRTLSELWMSGTDGVLLHSLTPGHTHDVVIADFLSPSTTASGREAFNLTCARCHGPDGQGSASADSFFKITIPRLSSPLVQGMTDDQLRAQINYGNKAMPPVETDEGGFRHRLPPQDVDAVIAYVRSLKK